MAAANAVVYVVTLWMPSYLHKTVVHWQESRCWLMMIDGQHFHWWLVMILVIDSILAALLEVYYYSTKINKHWNYSSTFGGEWSSFFCRLKLPMMHMLVQPMMWVSSLVLAVQLPFVKLASVLVLTSQIALLLVNAFSSARSQLFCFLWMAIIFV